MNVPKTPDHKLIGATRILANDAMHGAVDLNVLPAVLYEIADRLAELTQPQPIETAPRDGSLVHVSVGNTVLPVVKWIWEAWHYVDFYGEPTSVCNLNPTHWLPCVKVDSASLGGQADE